VSAAPKPSEILWRSQQLYSSLTALQVKVHTELPSLPGQHRIQLFLRRHSDLVAALPPQWEEGTFVHEREWRIPRGRALRNRVGFVGSLGACASHLPGRTVLAGYDTGRLSSVPPGPCVRQVRSADGGWSFPAYYLGMWIGGTDRPSADLPFKLFHASRSAAFLPAEQWQPVRSATVNGHQTHVLRFSLRHSCLVEGGGPKNWRFGSATWTVWIDQASYLIHRVEIHEEWDRRRPKPQGPNSGYLDIQEDYSNQELNAPYTEDDFLPEPPDLVAAPVAAVKQETSPGPPTQERGKEAEVSR
jgi:hypothetical protein